MEGLDQLDVIGTLIDILRANTAILADYGFRFGASLAAISLLFSLALASLGIGNAWQGTLGWIIKTGLILGCATFAPIIAEEVFNAADEFVRAVTGTGVTGLDVIERGATVIARVWEHGLVGSAYNPANWPQWIAIMVSAGLIFVFHVWISLLVSFSIVHFWLFSALMPITVMFLFIPVLSGVGAQALAQMVSGMIRLVVLGIIIGELGETFLEVTLPGETEELTLPMLFAPAVAIAVLTVISWTASSTASAIARGAAPSTGLNAIATTFFAGAAMRPAAGSAAAGSATHGGSSSAGSPPSASMSAGRASFGGQVGRVSKAS
jgi:hypothetical protein